MIASVAITSWILLNLVAISGDALIPNADAIKTQKAAKKFLRVISVTSGNESIAALDNSKNNNSYDGSGSSAKEEVKGMITTFDKTSRLQCAHRCKLNGTCKNVAHKDGNICHFFDLKEKEVTGQMEIIHPGMTSYDLYLSINIHSTRYILIGS